MANLLKPINFEPRADSPRPVKKDSTTAKVVQAILRKNGVSLPELARIIDKTEAQARTWVAESFLAPIGYGLRSETKQHKGKPALFVKGYTKDGQNKIVYSAPKAKKSVKAKADKEASKQQAA